MLECVGECGKEQQTMNQDQAGFHPEDPGVGSCGLRGSLRWPLLERGAVGGCNRGAWISGLPLQPLIHCLGLSGPALDRAPFLVMSARKGSSGLFSPIDMYLPSACQNERSKQRESGRAGVRMCTGVTGAPSAQGPHLGQGFDAH